MEQISMKKIAVGLLALMPLVFTLAWLISILTAKMTIDISTTGLSLSPIQNTGPIIISLVLFLAGYSIFLLLMFSENIRDAVKGILHK